MKVDKDWGYLYFLIPSIISFIFSFLVIIITLLNSNLRRKRFHQLSLLISIFSSIQSISWFRARYERNTTLCEIQEYIFQISTLLQSYIAVIICTTIYHTIKDGKALRWYNYRMIIWFLIPILSFILSCILGTAKLFCPFNYQHNLYYPNLTISNSVHFQHFLGYIFLYLFPMSFSWLLSAYYSYITSKYASEHFTNKIAIVAYQLRLYPIVLALCMFPISSFFFLVIIIDKEIHPLLFIGAILASSTGTINGVVYLTIVRHSSKKNRLTNYCHDNIHNIRNVQSVNYHLIISKLIKSSGQSYIIDEANSHTTSILRDGENDNDDDDNEEDDNDNNRRSGVSKRNTITDNGNNGNNGDNNNNNNNWRNDRNNKDYWSDDDDDENDDGYYEDESNQSFGNSHRNIQGGGGIGNEGSSSKNSSKDFFRSSFGSSKSGGMFGVLFEAFYLPRVDDKSSPT